MILTLLKNTAYTYFPRGVCSINERQKYLDSEEYKRLYHNSTTVFDDEEFKNSYDRLITEFKKHTQFKAINDVSVLQWQDRCLSFEIDYVEENILSKICIRISLLVPYYLIYVTENEIEINPYSWKTLPVRNITKEQTIYKDHIDLLFEIINNVTGFIAFPEEYADIIITDLCFNDVKMGNFTLYNAFFLDDNKFKPNEEQNIDN